MVTVLLSERRAKAQKYLVESLAGIARFATACECFDSDTIIDAWEPCFDAAEGYDSPHEYIAQIERLAGLFDAACKCGHANEAEVLTAVAYIVTFMINQLDV